MIKTIVAITYYTAVMLLRFFPIRFLADLPQTFSARRTFNPPDVYFLPGTLNNFP